MSKDIRQYLHYYIGQPYRYRYIDWEFHQWTVWTKLTLDRLKALDDISIDGIELALRKLEDIKEKEAIELLKHLSLIELSDCTFEVTNEDGWISVDAYYNNSVLRDGYQFDYNVLQMLTNGGEYKDLNPQTEVTHFILQRGFDLFGLISAGLAIDSATLTNK